MYSGYGFPPGFQHIAYPPFPINRSQYVPTYPSCFPMPPPPPPFLYQPMRPQVPPTNTAIPPPLPSGPPRQRLAVVQGRVTSAHPSTAQSRTALESAEILKAKLLSRKRKSRFDVPASVSVNGGTLGGGVVAKVQKTCDGPNNEDGYNFPYDSYSGEYGEEEGEYEEEEEEEEEEVEKSVAPDDDDWLKYFSFKPQLKFVDSTESFYDPDNKKQKVTLGVGAYLRGVRDMFKLPDIEKKPVKLKPLPWSALPKITSQVPSYITADLVQDREELSAIRTEMNKLKRREEWLSSVMLREVSDRITTLGVILSRPDTQDLPLGYSMTALMHRLKPPFPCASMGEPKKNCRETFTDLEDYYIHCIGEHDAPYFCDHDARTLTVAQVTDPMSFWTDFAPVRSCVTTKTEQPAIGELRGDVIDPDKWASIRNCPFCNNELEYGSNYRYHMAARHEHNYQSQQCRVCKSVLPTPLCRVLHEEFAHHEDDLQEVLNAHSAKDKAGQKKKRKTRLDCYCPDNKKEFIGICRLERPT